MHNHHHHEHTHSHVLPTQIGKTFSIAIGLNLAFVFIEFGMGVWQHSLALMSDAGHNLSDVFSLVISAWAIKLSRKKATAHYTYGFHKTTVLAALFNSLLLLLVVGGIVYEAILRIGHGQVIDGPSISMVATLGIILNGATALLFMKQQQQDANIKGAFLHMLADTLVSLGVVVSGIIISYTSWYWMDSLMSIIISIIIIASTWGLLKEAFKLSLDGVPTGINLQQVRNMLLNIPGVHNIHDLHIWALGTSNTALTVHIELAQQLTLTDIEELKANARHQLMHLNIHHITIETETSFCQMSPC